jgi:hypothetical protein
VEGNYKTAIWQWNKTGWYRRDGYPVENAELWKRFIKHFTGMRKRASIEWVPSSHRNRKQKDPYNDRADKLAKSAAQHPLSRREHRSIARRKTTAHKTEVGSIKAEGQMLVILVVTSIWMKVQRLNKYRCQVVNGDSPYFGRMDFLYSTLNLREAHYYEIQLSDGGGVPMIVTELRELTAEQVAVLAPQDKEQA